ncbi:DUF3951 domain-containing protein [Bacillus sp. B-jedd]|nr:DUF3951 domain-containing protein [Bacillus sp. B-jedd]CEG28799.1 hypothetical protein BN1002_03722 [Bacillus sp. B-jedd]
MAYLFLAIVVGAVGITLFKMMRKRNVPDNHYTPFDDVTEGRTTKE